MAAAFSPEFLKDVRAFLAQHASSSRAASSQDSPAATQLQAWLTAYNNGDRPQLQGFYAKYLPTRQESMPDEMQRRQSITGGYELKKFELRDDTSCSAILKMCDLEQYVRLCMAVSSLKLHVVESFDAEPIPGLLSFPRPGYPSRTRSVN
jgi:hypothetical protein